MQANRRDKQVKTRLPNGEEFVVPGRYHYIRDTPRGEIEWAAETAVARAEAKTQGRGVHEGILYHEAEVTAEQVIHTCVCEHPIYAVPYIMHNENRPTEIPCKVDFHNLNEMLVQLAELCVRQDVTVASFGIVEHLDEYEWSEPTEQPIVNIPGEPELPNWPNVGHRQ